MTLNFGLRRNLTGNFCICEVDRPMIRADFLGQHGLLVDIKRQCIIYSLTQHIRHGSLKPAPQTVSTIAPGTSYKDLFMQFPRITIPRAATANKRHAIVHHIVTRGPPVFERPDVWHQRNTKQQEWNSRQ